MPWPSREPPASPRPVRPISWLGSRAAALRASYLGESVSAHAARPSKYDKFCGRRMRVMPCRAAVRVRASGVTIVSCRLRALEA